MFKALQHVFWQNTDQSTFKPFHHLFGLSSY